MSNHACESNIGVSANMPCVLVGHINACCALQSAPEPPVAAVMQHVSSNPAHSQAAAAGLNRTFFYHVNVLMSCLSLMQVEGAAFTDGRTASVWDIYTALNRDKIADRSTGIVATDHYHKYKQDLQLMRAMNIKHYR